VDDGTVHGPSFNRETSNANQPFKEMMEPTYYTASVDSNSMAGQVSHQVIESSSPRQVMRFAARFNAAGKPSLASFGT
jgi:hypothetical protein